MFKGGGGKKEKLQPRKRLKSKQNRNILPFLRQSMALLPNLMQYG
jgi:hypothetical protein